MTGYFLLLYLKQKKYLFQLLLTHMNGDQLCGLNRKYHTSCEEIFHLIPLFYLLLHWEQRTENGEQDTTTELKYNLDHPYVGLWICWFIVVNICSRLFYSFRLDFFFVSLLFDWQLKRFSLFSRFQINIRYFMVLDTGCRCNLRHPQK